MFLVGSHMILYDSTIFYDPSVILNVLVRWDCKIVWSYNAERDFDNYDCMTFQMANTSYFLY